MLKGSKIKVMKMSKNRRGLTQVKVIFLHINKQEIFIYHDYKEIHTKKYCFWLCCTFGASYWHINCKINWERIFKRLHYWAISFWDSLKKFRRTHQRWSIKRLFLRILQYSHENTYAGVSFHKVAGLQSLY